MSTETILKYLKPGDIITVCVVFVIGWFLYKNFVRNALQEYDKKISMLQTKENCLMMQTGCQRVLVEKMDKIDKIASEKIVEIDKKIDLVLARQVQVISRIDQHIDKTHE